MDRSFLEFGLPLWWILPAFILAAGLAFLLYQKRNVPWNKNKNILLGTSRFLAILLILLLFLNPIIQQYRDEIERPVVIIGVDNSSSIGSVHDKDEQELILDIIDQVAEEMDDKDYNYVVRSLSGETFDSLDMKESKTDISRFFRLMSEEFSGQNLASMVVLTDGIYNRGTSPEFRPYNFPVIAVGLGDSIAQKDISISRVRNNDVAYSGNEFPVEVEISREGYEEEVIELTISKDDKILERVDLGPGVNRHVFFLSADNEGAVRYVINASEEDGEVTYENNRFDLFMEILESKKQVLISARAPHPDIKAIRSALEGTGNYDISLFIEGLNSQLDRSDFDVQIIFDGLKKIEGVNGYWVVNSSSSGDQLKDVPFIQVEEKGPADMVTPALNSDFSSFKLNREIGRLKGYPPVAVPFGDYQLSGPNEILFYQRVGSVVTDKPLMTVIDDGSRRVAVSLGLGIWQWKLQESARYGDHVLFTEFVQKLVQYLSINENKKQFRVTRGLESFTENEVVFFDVEVYDDIFQNVEGQPYSVEVTNEENQTQSFEFVFGSENKVAETKILPPGTYSYTALTTLAGKTLRDQGQFVVNALQLEQRSLTANHKLLRAISRKSQGEFFHLNESEDLIRYIQDSEYSGIIHSSAIKTPMIKYLWILLLIASLLGAEWVLRKVWGAY